MIARIPENVSTWLADGSIVTIMGNTVPPRDPRTKITTMNRTMSRQSSGNPEPDE
jgi:hypothetical protein